MGPQGNIKTTANNQAKDVSRKGNHNQNNGRKRDSKRPEKGRVVITHSTYLPGLITLLEELATYPNIQTITPAVISRVKSNAPKFRMKVSVPITGGHKLIARHRKSAQEVFVITTLTKAEIEKAIAHILA